MGDKFSETISMKHKEISDLIERAFNPRLCKRILLFLVGNQELDGFDYTEMRKALRVKKEKLDMNLDYLKGAKILDENYHITPETKEYIVLNLKKNSQQEN